MQHGGICNRRNRRLCGSGRHFAQLSRGLAEALLLQLLQALLVERGRARLPRLVLCMGLRERERERVSE